MTHVICENYFIQQHLCLPASLAPKGEKKKKNLTGSANAYDFPNNNNKKRNNNTGVLRISVTAEVINWNFWFTETDWLQLNWLKLIDQGLIKIMNCLQLLKIGSCFIKPCQSPSVGMRYSVSMSFFHEHHLGHTNFSANINYSTHHECNDPGSGKAILWKIKNYCSVTKTAQQASAAVRMAKRAQPVANAASTADLKTAALSHSSASSIERYRLVAHVDLVPVLMQSGNSHSWRSQGPQAACTAAAAVAWRASVEPCSP